VTYPNKDNFIEFMQFVVGHVHDDLLVTGVGSDMGLHVACDLYDLSAISFSFGCALHENLLSTYPANLGIVQCLL
jgi:hypothetical protein